ncbi:MAG: aldehyde dehydrogenase family protein [Planctomycetes bacterium]|nr:aldehyde dehydrogenase family protein [Planctomycetota bacterium]
MGGDHGNLINGRWRAAGPGEGFVVSGAAGEELTRRPRSSAHELEEALGVLEGSCQSWSQRPQEERLEVVRAMDLAGVLAGWAGALGSRLGLEEAAAVELLCDDLEEARQPERDGVSGPGVALVRAAPTTLMSGLLPLVQGALARGRSVLVLADPALPWLAEAVARAWGAAGGAPEVLALLHDDGATAARALLRSGRLTEVAVRDYAARLREVESQLASPQRESFGAGVLESGRCEVSFLALPVRDSTASVTSDMDPEEAASSICDAAFGQKRALGGERGASLGRVSCHEALFSVFTRALLECFDALESVAGPSQAPLRADFGDWSEELSQLAVGEGATCLRGGPTDSIGKGRRAKITKSVFTNVEPNWRLSRASRPAPALSLMRAHSDVSVRELARACDA